jgi:hypothetical protein
MRNNAAQILEGHVMDLQGLQGVVRENTEFYQSKEANARNEHTQIKN